jgi:hypothetical protein
MLVAKSVPGFVYEDRGHDIRKYGREEWMLAQAEDGYILDEIKFQSVGHINGVVSGIDTQGNHLTINVQKINVGYYDPFMKALEQIDRVPVTSMINNKSGVIVYMPKDSNEVIATRKMNPKPQEKYR